MFSGHKTVFCGIDPFFFLIVEYSLLDLVIYCYPLNKVQECIEHFLKWLNLKGSFKKTIKQIFLIKKSHCLVYSQVMFKLIENVFVVTGWVGGIVYDYSVESSVSFIELFVLEITMEK